MIQQDDPFSEKSLKSLFVKEFPQYSSELEGLLLKPYFKEMLVDYFECVKESAHLQKVQSRLKSYNTLKYELQEEILKYIHLNVNK